MRTSGAWISRRLLWRSLCHGSGLTTDQTAPSVPGALQVEAGPYSLRLSWQPSEDNTGQLKRYTVFLNGQAYQRTKTCTCDVVGLEPDTEYLLEVEAEDQAGNKSDKAAIRAFTRANLIEYVPADDETQGFYTLDGRYIGTLQPRTSGVYIQRKRQKTNLLIIQ